MLQPRRRTARRLLPVLAMLALGIGATTARADVPIHVEPFTGGLHDALPADAPVKAVGEPFALAQGQVHAAALANDEPAGALLMGRDFSTTQNTTGAVLLNEPEPICPDPDSSDQAVVDTVWYRFKGTGGNVLINTLGSDFDTVLVVYRSTSLVPATAFCDDDPDQDDFPGETWSEVYMPTVAGADYLIQVGGCAAAACAPTEGELGLTVLGSDERRTPGPLSANGVGSTIGTYIDNLQEPRTCQGVGYASTLWYRFTVTRPGKVSFSMNTNNGNFRPAARIYPVASTTPLAPCGVGTGASPIAAFDATINAGTYLIQVGGVDGEWGLFSYSFRFAPNNNVDRDRESWPADCNDNDPTIYHGAHDGRDGKNNDCDAFTDEDYDGDFYESRAAGGEDCNDRNRAINPKAKEKAGNGVDEDCKNGPRFRQLPTDLKSAFHTSDLSLDSLEVYPVKPGSTVKVKCRGGGCDRRSLKKFFPRAKGKFSLMSAFGDVNFLAGARLEIRVTKPFWIGKVFTLRRQGNGVPERTRCVRPGKKRLRKCG
jgi:hypothetical protein